MEAVRQGHANAQAREVRAPEVVGRRDLISGKAKAGDIVPVLKPSPSGKIDERVNTASPAILLGYSKVENNGITIIAAKVMPIGGSEAGKIKTISDVQVAENTSKIFGGTSNTERRNEISQQMLNRAVTIMVADNSVKYATRSELEKYKFSNGEERARLLNDLQGRVVAINTPEGYKPAVYLEHDDLYGGSNVLYIAGQSAGKIVSVPTETISNSPERNLNPEFRKMMASKPKDDKQSGSSSSGLALDPAVGGKSAAQKKEEAEKKRQEEERMRQQNDQGMGMGL